LLILVLDLSTASNKGDAHITDFGFSIMSTQASRGTPTTGFTKGYEAPEIKDGRHTPTKESDVFAFGMMMFEVASKGASPQVINTKEITTETTSFSDTLPERFENTPHHRLIWSLIRSQFSAIIPGDRPSFMEIAAPGADLENLARSTKEIYPEEEVSDSPVDAVEQVVTITKETVSRIPSPPTSQSSTTGAIGASGLHRSPSNKSQSGRRNPCMLRFQALFTLSSTPPSLNTNVMVSIWKHSLHVHKNMVDD
jgi:hypothetical protein